MFILEGNIGAGKSTFITLLRRYAPSIVTAYEPLVQWDTPVNGESLLGNFITTPHRWSYTIETYTMINRVREHLHYQKVNEPLFLLERSIYSGHYVFAVNGRKQGFMTTAEWGAYTKFFDFLIPQCRPPRGFIYLQVDPSIALDRIEKRRRGSESSISLDYLQQVHDRHEEFLVHKVGVGNEIRNVPVLVLDCNKEFETDGREAQRLIEQAVSFMHLHRDATACVESRTTLKAELAHD